MEKETLRPIPQRPNLAPDNGITYEMATHAKKKHRDELFNLPAFSGASSELMQTPETNGHVIGFYSMRELTPEERESIPTEFDGVPLVYKGVKVFRALGE